MTKKHYIAIAKLLKLVDESSYHTHREAVLDIAHGLDELFRSDNAKFDSVKFREAIYGTK